MNNENDSSESCPDWEAMIAAVNQTAAIVGKWKVRLQHGVRVGDDGRPMWRSVDRELTEQFRGSDAMMRLQEADRLVFGSDQKQLPTLLLRWVQVLRDAARPAERQGTARLWSMIEDAADVLLARLSRLRDGIDNASRGIPTSYPTRVAPGSLIEILARAGAFTSEKPASPSSLDSMPSGLWRPDTGLAKQAAVHLADAATKDAVAAVRRQPGAVRGAGEKQEELSEGYFFYRKNQMTFTLRAFGQSATLSNLTGLQQLHDIVFAKDSGAKMSRMIGVPEGGEIRSRDPAQSRGGLDAIRRELDELEAQRILAVEDEETEKAEEIRERMKVLIKLRRADTTPRGRPRDLAGNVAKWRATISGNLKTVYRKLDQQGAGTIAEHFKRNIRSTGTSELTAVFRYVTSPKITWTDSPPEG